LHDLCVDQRLGAPRASLSSPFGHGWEAPIAFGGGNPNADNAYGELIDNIRTFNEEMDEGMELRVFQEIFCGSRRFVFLGFHFHKKNLELITPRAMQQNAEIRDGIESLEL
jgi:hypothetical protein